MSQEESQVNTEEQSQQTLLLDEKVQSEKKFDKEKSYTHIGLWFSVFYYSTFQVIGLIFGVILLLIMGTLNFIEVDSNGNYDPNSTNAILALLIVNLIATLAVGFIIFGFNKKLKFIPSKVSFSLSKYNWKLLGFGLALMFFIVGGLQLLVNVVETNFFPDFSVETPYGFFDSDNIGILIFATILVSIAAPIAEEIFYRWTMIQTLKRGMNKIATVIFSSLIFAFAHSSANLNYSFYYFVLHFVSTFLIGLILGTIYILTNKVIITIILHAVWNFIISISAFFDFFNLYNVYFIIYLVIIGLAGVGTIVGCILIIVNRKKNIETIETKSEQEKIKIKLKPEWFTLILGYFGLIVLIPYLIHIFTSVFSFGEGFISVVYLGLLMVFSIFLVTKIDSRIPVPQKKALEKTEISHNKSLDME